MELLLIPPLCPKRETIPLATAHADLADLTNHDVEIRAIAGIPGAFERALRWPSRPVSSSSLCRMARCRMWTSRRHTRRVRWSSTSRS